MAVPFKPLPNEFTQLSLSPPGKTLFCNIADFLNQSLWWCADTPILMCFNQQRLVCQSWRGEQPYWRSRLQQIGLCRSLWCLKHILNVCAITLTARGERQKFHTVAVESAEVLSEKIVWKYLIKCTQSEKRPIQVILLLSYAIISLLMMHQAAFHCCS